MTIRHALIVLLLFTFALLMYCAVLGLPLFVILASGLYCIEYYALIATIDAS